MPVLLLWLSVLLLWLSHFPLHSSTTVQFHRAGSGISQYRSYLNYVREIGGKMGFKVHEDVLRIPSTKRVRRSDLWTVVHSAL